MFAIVKAFIAGFVSTLTFHQALAWVFNRLDLTGYMPWDMAPVPPFAVPSVISLAFWGGLWGIVIWLLIRRALAAGYYVGAMILGAIGPSVVALTLVPWLRGQAVVDIAGALSPQLVAFALAVNAAWGLGLAVFMRFMHPPR